MFRRPLGQPPRCCFGAGASAGVLVAVVGVISSIGFPLLFRLAALGGDLFPYVGRDGGLSLLPAQPLARLFAQIAIVGLTENQARAMGFNISVKVHDYSDVAYGWAMEDTTGIAKIIVEAETGKILGAHIMGHQASSLIQPIIQAMSFGLHGQDMARGQYWIHPALPEVIENALLSLCGEPPWPPSRRH